MVQEVKWTTHAAKKCLIIIDLSNNSRTWYCYNAMVLHRPYYQEILDCVSGASKLTASYGEICEKEYESECKSTVTFSNTITDRSPPPRPVDSRPTLPS